MQGLVSPVSFHRVVNGTAHVQGISYICNYCCHARPSLPIRFVLLFRSSEIALEKRAAAALLDYTTTLKGCIGTGAETDESAAYKLFRKILDLGSEYNLDLFGQTSFLPLSMPLDLLDVVMHELVLTRHCIHPLMPEVIPIFGYSLRGCLYPQLTTYQERLLDLMRQTVECELSRIATQPYFCISSAPGS